VAREVAAARGGTAAPTAEGAPSGVEFGGCGCAIAAGGTSEAATGRQRNRLPRAGVPELRLVEVASGDAAQTGVAAAPSSGAATLHPRQAPARESPAVGGGGGVAVAAWR